MVRFRLICMLMLGLVQVSQAQEKFDPNGKDWGIPRATPRPLVWIADWKEPEKEKERTAQQQQALQAMRLADQLKSGEEFAKAEKSYQEAIKLDPQLSMASYQLACNYELWGKTKESKLAFDQAVEAGFSDYASAFDDDELGSIRRATDFSQKLKLIRERYLKVQPSLLGQPVAFKPPGAKPAKGWPVIILLHGKGDSHRSFFSEGEEWANLGVLAIAMPGTIPGMVDGFVWDGQTTEPTHQNVQACLQSTLVKDLIDSDRVMLLGFSQGGLHALGLLKTHPESYAGVLALSPGGTPISCLTPGKLPSKQTKKLYFIHGKEEPHAPFAKMFRDACKTAGWQFKLEVHPGGHQLPENWDNLRLPAKQFLLGE